MYQRSSRRVALTVAAWALFAFGCATPDVYWTKGDSAESQFRSASRTCNRTAITTLSNESGEQCAFNTGAGGTICRRPDPSDPFQAEQVKRRQERRLRFLYGECMESRGWTPNYDGKGFKGRY